MTIKLRIENATIFYEKKYSEEVNIIQECYYKICKLINNLWGIEKPKYFKIYIMKSDLKYILYSYPIYIKILTIILLPFWYLKVKKEWEKYPGASDLKSNPPSILLKPLEICKNFDSNNKRSISKENESLKQSYKLIFCQLLVYIYIYKLELPIWLVRGVTIFTEENFTRIKYIKNRTIKLFNDESYKLNNLGAYKSTKGYWTVRYLEENYPGFLKETFKKYKGEEIVKEIGKKLNLDTDSKERFWKQLDELLYDNYKYLLNE